jgi:hypothetical protein
MLNVPIFDGPNIIKLVNLKKKLAIVKNNINFMLKFENYN